ncbi:MAG TPA: glycosyl hydrolase family 28-related protein [Methylophilaceae bacterium]
MGLKLFNNASGILAMAISDSATSLTLRSGHGSRFPALGPEDWFPITVVRASDPTQLEIMRCIGRVGDTLTVVRGQEGTAQRAFPAGSVVEMRLTAGTLEENFLQKSDLGSANAGTATKLKTARTLTIGKTGKSFDGSANVSWSLDEIGLTAFGLGGTAAPIPGDNIDDSTIPTGFYYVTPTTSGTKPVAGSDEYGHLIVSRGHEGVDARQVYLDNTTNRIWTRVWASSQWSEWSEVYHSGIDLANVVTVQAEGTGAVPRTVQDKLREVVSVKDFGAVGDGVTDDTAAIQLAVDYLNHVSATTPASLVFPSGRYLITDEIDLTATGGKRREIIGGNGFETAELLVNFSGHDKYVFKLGDPTAPAYQRGISIRGFHFTKVNNNHRAPVGIGGNAIAQSRISDIVFGGWDNTAVQLYAPQNCRFEKITTFGGGHSWDYKSTTGITVLQSGTTLTASGDIFSASDVGKTVNLWGVSSSTRRKALITGYISPTQVTVNTSYTDVNPLRIYFGSPFASMTAGSATLTADAPCFAPEDVGIVIYVKGAGANGRLLRSKISAYVSPTQVTLEDVAGTTVTTAEFATPVIDMHSVGASSGKGASDNSFYALQVESHQGVAFCGIDLDQLSFEACKMHGEQTIAPKKYALAPMWIDYVSGYYQGSFTAQYLGEELMYAVYQTAPFVFESLSCRIARDGRFLRIGPRAPGFEGGLIQLDDVSFQGTSAGLVDFNDLIVDVNTPPGYVLSGKLSNFETNVTKVYLGNGVYGTPARGVAVAEPAGIFNIYRYGDGGTVGSSNVLTSTVTWDGTPPSGKSSLRYSWQRVGNVVHFWMRLKYEDAGANNSSLTIELPSDMPAPYFLNDTSNALQPSWLIGTVSGGLATSATAVCEPSSGFLRRKAAGTGFEVGVVNNSGTVSALVGYVQGFYFTR